LGDLFSSGKQQKAKKMLTAVISGNVGKDAALRDAGGTPVCSFSVASNSKVRGEKVTTWIDVSVFGARGQALQPHITAGTKIVVQGELSTREHNGKTYLQINADRIDLMGGGRRDEPQQNGRAPQQSRGGHDDRYSGPGAGDSDDMPFSPIGDVG
jgi:single-strand DNA-binding protein